MQEVLTGHLSDNIKITKVKDHSAAGTSPITSDEIDMAGYEGVIFITSFSVANAGNLVTFGDGLTTGSQAPTVAHVHTTGGTTEEDVILDVLHPRRFVNVIATVGSSSTVESIWAIQYGARFKDVTSALTGTIASAKFQAPAVA